MPAPLLGPTAGLLTSVCWTATSILFTEAGRRVGATTVNAIRIVLAVILLAATFRFVTSDGGAWWPDASPRQIVLLALSGIVGLSIGDQALFTAFVDVGPRLASLLMTTAPLFAALFGWLALGETLGGPAWLGVALTLGGVAVVILERPGPKVPFDPAHRARGIALGVLAAACQAGGLLLSKLGMGHGALPPEAHLDPQAATYVRMAFAALGVAPIVLIYRSRRSSRAAARRSRRIGSPRTGLLLVALGTLVGPYAGVWLSLVAADATHVGVAQTLMSLTPILILPFAMVLHHERIGPRAIAGTIVAVVGVAVLFVNAG